MRAILAHMALDDSPTMTRVLLNTDQIKLIRPSPTCTPHKICIVELCDGRTAEIYRTLDEIVKRMTAGDPL